MQHKRLISMGLSLILAISAAACGGATGAISSDNRSAAAAADAETETSEVPETAASEVTGEVPGAAEAEDEIRLGRAVRQRGDGLHDARPALRAGELAV